MYIKKFKELTIDDVKIAGGKGASLGEMMKAGISVPDGFVILSSVFDGYLKNKNIKNSVEKIVDKINYDDAIVIEKSSKKIRNIIETASIPQEIEKDIVDNFKKLDCKFIAVRSSATAEDSCDASWAGELESFLNTNEKTLIENVKKCWSSLYTSRAIIYRKEQGLENSHVSVAVVVQEMIESEVSGITFTVHPVSENKNEMIIEAGWGLGEAIVSGSITPDSYVVNKTDNSLLDIQTSMQEKQVIRDIKNGVKWVAVKKNKQQVQKIEGRQIIQLAKICAEIEKYYKKPQDIEWAFKDKKFYIVQSRPITTL